MAEEENKSFNKIADMLAEVKDQGLSATQEASALKKIMSGNTTTLAQLFSDGMDLSKISNANQKVIADAVRASGEEITSADEKRALETQKTLMEIAFKAQKADITAQKILAKDEGSRGKLLGLTFKEGWIEAKNTWDTGLINLQEGIAQSKDIRNLGSAFSQDMSILTTEFQGLMSIPGMKTISAGVKFIAAWLATLMTPIVKKWLLGDKEAGTKGLLGRAGAKIKESATGAKSFVMGGEARDDKGQFTTKFSQENIFGKMKIGFKEMGKNIESGWKEAGKQIPILQEKISSFFTKLGGEGGPFNMKTIKGKLDAFKGKMGDWSESLQKFSATEWLATKKATAKAKIIALKKRIAESQWLKNMKSFFEPGMLKRMAKGAKGFIRAVGRFLLQVGIFIGGLIVAFIGFLIANLPLILLIGLIILIAIGLVLLFKKISENWEVIKVKMAMAGDRLRLVGTKISNWFKDAASDIGYKIKLVIAKMKDGIAGIGNAIIDAINKKKKDWFGGDDIIDMRLEGGAVDKVEATRTDDLAKRKARDDKLQADFDAKYAERGKELEAAAIKDAERNAEKDAKETSDKGDIITTVNTDNSETQLFSESTQVSDHFTTQAIQQRM